MKILCDANQGISNARIRQALHVKPDPAYACLCLMGPICFTFHSPPEAMDAKMKLVVDRARAAFQTGKTRPLEFRIQQLKALERMLKEKEKEIATALMADLHKVDILCLLKTTTSTILQGKLQNYLQVQAGLNV